VSFIHLEAAAKYVTEEEESYARAMEELMGFFSAFPSAMEMVYEEHPGFLGMDSLDAELLRTKFRIWKESQLSEKRSVAGRQPKHVKKKAQTASGKKSSPPRKK
jgi:hypothetical protein